MAEDARFALNRYATEGVRKSYYVNVAGFETVDDATLKIAMSAPTAAWGASGFDADNWFHGQVHSESPGNRWRMSDPDIDQWAEAQQLELDPDARRELHRKIWDRDLEMMYRPTLPYGFSFDIRQPWLRGIRFGGVMYSNGSYYDWGHQAAGAWLDK